jgi:AcrR family transcriptional regulator
MLDDYLPQRRPPLRKLPVQARSTETLAWIREAAEELIIEGGIGALTTTRVAERAGVSIGSLYQYAADIDELLAHVVEAHLARERDALEAVLRDAPTLSLGELVDRLVDGFVGAFAERPELSAHIYGELRRAPWGPRLDELGVDACAAVAELLRRRADPSVIPDPALAAFVIVSSVDSTVQRAAAQRPDDLRSGTVAAEIRRLVRRYVLGGGSRPRT